MTLNRVATRLACGVAIACAVATSSKSSAQEIIATEIAPTQVRTVAPTHCGEQSLSTPGTTCQGFAGRAIVNDSSLFVVGFENSATLGEKFVYQTVVMLDLSSLSARPGVEISMASLHYTEASTTRRSASDESEYGVLPTCNTRLGVPASGSWDGNVDNVIVTAPAAIAGVAGATTAGTGSWDVTPQIKQWLAAGQIQGAFVMGGEDESLDIQAQSMCLSYVFGVGLSVEQRTQP